MLSERIDRGLVLECGRDARLLVKDTIRLDRDSGQLCTSLKQHRPQQRGGEGDDQRDHHGSLPGPQGGTDRRIREL